MATPTINTEYEAKKQRAKERIAAGGCHALSFWSRTDAERLCPPEHKDFEQIEAPVYNSEWVYAGKKAIQLIQSGIDLLDESSPPQSGEGKSMEEILKDLKQIKTAIIAANSRTSKLREALEDCDTLFASLEDFTHGDDGDRITKQRWSILEALKEQ